MATRWSIVIMFMKDLCFVENSRLLKEIDNKK